MGFTLSQIDKHFNEIVNTYKSLKFSEVPCSEHSYIRNTYRFVDLYNNNKHNNIITHRISLNPIILDDVNGFARPIYCLDLIDTMYINNVCKSENKFKRFYKIDNNYYTIHLNEVKHVRDLQLKRYINNIIKSKSRYIDVSKLSDKAIAYLSKRIDTSMDALNRSHKYKIHNVYFSYRGTSRKLVVVIKHQDSLGTEAVHFN